MMITLLKHFTFAAANNGQFLSEWVRVPEGYQTWQLVFEVHSRISTTAGSGQLQTTWDTATPSNLGTTPSLSAVGIATQDITSGVGPMVRVALSATADTAVVVSVFLTPKTS